MSNRERILTDDQRTTAAAQLLELVRQADAVRGLLTPGHPVISDTEATGIVDRIDLGDTEAARVVGALAAGAHGVTPITWTATPLGAAVALADPDAVIGVRELARIVDRASRTVREQVDRHGLRDSTGVITAAAARQYIIDRQRAR